MPDAARSSGVQILHGSVRQRDTLACTGRRHQTTSVRAYSGTSWNRVANVFSWTVL